MRFGGENMFKVGDKVRAIMPTGATMLFRDVINPNQARPMENAE